MWVTSDSAADVTYFTHAKVAAAEAWNDETPQISNVYQQHLNGSVKEPNKFHTYETEKITRKASDAAE